MCGTVFFLPYSALLPSILCLNTQCMIVLQTNGTVVRGPRCAQPPSSARNAPSRKRGSVYAETTVRDPGETATSIHSVAGPTSRCHILSRTGQSAGPRSRHPSIPRATGDALPPYRFVASNESSMCPLVPVLRQYAHCRASSTFEQMSRLSATSRGLP